MAPHDFSSASRWRRNRPNATLLEQHVQPMSNSTDMHPPRLVPKPDRAPSRMSLFNLFSKPKVERARGHTEVGLAIPMEPPRESPKPRPASPPKSSLRPNPPPQTQQLQRMRSTQMLRPSSMRPPSLIRKPTSAAPSDDHWTLPPLFQAYPQAIKFATVQACLSSSDVLIRTQSQRSQAESMRQRIDNHRDLGKALESVSEHKKLEKTHKRLDSILTAMPQLATKIYLLATSGHVLQYSGDGPFDRLPEKVLKLGKDSAAFASDLIPGKHWVLQILQSANEDGTVSVDAGPKPSLLSKLRIHAPTRREAPSFLLVMESAEEMESWMTTVRKEIENLGGMKASTESSRPSSVEGSPEKPSTERPYQRQPVRRDSSRMSMLAPIDSPLQLQDSVSPKTVTSDWGNDRKEKTVSTVDSAFSMHSKRSAHRQSIEPPSTATTAGSFEQLQLDQLRERSRFSSISYVSTAATSVSGTGTRTASRDPSPAPASPIKETPPLVEVESRRSETSLRSFHMHPGNSSARRRSMQPLPVTNEDSSVSAQIAQAPKRHSICPASPTTPPRASERRKLEAGAPMSQFCTSGPNAAATTGAQSQLPARYTVRSSSAPPRPSMISPISPPPTAPLPAPPAARPQSIIGNLATAPSTPSNPTGRRTSAAPKLFIRPFPVRPQSQNADGSCIVQRRSSAAPRIKPAPLPLGIVVNRSVTSPARSPPKNTASPAAMASQPQQANTAVQATPAGQTLRRPTSVFIRNDPAPFLSSSRRGTPTATVRTSAPVVPLPAPPSSIRQSPSIPVLRGHGQQLAPQKEVTPRRSMPQMGLPPPAPPPDMPLPLPPSAAPLTPLVV